MFGILLRHARGPLFLRLCALSALFLSHSLAAVTYVMNSYNGSDGPFTVTSLDGYSVNQANSNGSGGWSSFQYYLRPAGDTFASAVTLYAEVDYVDAGGSGAIGMQYNAVGNAFQNVGFALNNGVEGTGTLKTAVFMLPNASFSYSENGGTDLRLTQGGALQMNIVQVRVSDQPTALYLQLTSFLGPYTGLTLTAGPVVDASTMLHKLICGYQGWFRTPNDDDDVGWQHWTRNWGTLNPSLISEDYWPDMTEFTSPEQFAAPGFTNSDGSQAMLFSSDRTRTVLRHFQWMQSWGIDGVAVQRFVGGLMPASIDSYRVLTDVRAAANQTGRTYFVEYDMTGVTQTALVSTIAADWQYLVSTLQLTNDPRYLHHNGLPVVGVYGFFASRFDTPTANAILNIFQSGGPYQAFVAGAGEWYWRTDPMWSSAWNAVQLRMGSWQPWNEGNLTGGSPDYAQTSYWSTDISYYNSNNVLYVPELYPGASSNNRDGVAWGSETIPRLQGKFVWQQFATAQQLGVQSMFLGMFDELDEGTEIVKVANTPPSQANFLNYEGLPSDCYLCLASQGAQMVYGKIPYSATPPNCPGMTKPSIPDTISPTINASATGPVISLTWSQAFVSQPVTATVAYYQVMVDGVTYTTTTAQTLNVSLGAGNHTWEVQAFNIWGNPSGWSLMTPFSVSGPALSPTPSFTPPPSPTSSPSPTASPTASPSPTPYVLGSTCSPPLIDGILNDPAWTAAYSLSISNLDVGGTAGATASFQTRYDPNYFYVGVTVNDPQLYYNAANSDWNNSAVEFYLNTNYPTNSSPYTAGDFQYIVDWNSVSSTCTCLNDGYGSMTGVLYGTTTTAGGYTVELAVPWTTLGKVPSPGLQLGFDVALDINHSTPGTGGRTAQIIWSGGATAYMDTSQFGVLSLGSLCVPSPTPTSSKSPSPTASPSSSPSSTGTLNPSMTISPSSTPSPSPSLTRTPSPSMSSTQSPLPSPTSSATGTLSPSPSRTSTASPSISPSSTWTTSPMPSATASPSPTRTPSPTMSLTQSPLPSPTSSASETFSPSPSHTSTGSPSISPSSTWTTSPTPSATLSSSPTLSATETFSPSPSRTFTLGPSMTSSPTLTTSPMPSATSSSSPSETRSPSPSMSLTQSPLPSSTSTSTVTLSSSPSHSPTASPSPSPTSTLTSSSTPTASSSSTPSLTLSPSPSSSRTPSASPSVTGTFTTSPTASPQQSPTQSLTPNLSASATPSSSLSPSPSSSATSTPSSSASPTWTASLTESPIPSPTRSPSPSLSPTPSLTLNPSLTASPSLSPSFSPSLTVSLTESPVSSPTSSPSPSLSPSQSPSASPSCSLSPSSTLSASPTESPVFSPTSSPSPSFSSTPNPSLSPSPSLSPTPSATETPSLTRTPSVSPSPSLSASRTPTPSSSPTLSPTLSFSPSPQPSASVSPTIVWSPSSSPTTTPTTQSTPQPSPIISSLSQTNGPSSGGTSIIVSGSNFEPGITATLGGVATSVTWLSNNSVEIVSPPNPSGWVTLVLTNEPSGTSGSKTNAFDYLPGQSPTLSGPLAILLALPNQNPSPNGPSAFKVEVSGAVSSLTLDVYTEAMEKVFSISVMGNPSSDWQTISLPQNTFTNFSSGIYYYVITVSDGPDTAHRVGKFAIYR